MRHGTRKSPSRRSRAAVRFDQEATQHFLLDAIGTWWGKVFPSAYGVFLRIGSPEGGETGALQDFLLTVRRGRIESFCMPDISSLGPERRMQKDHVIRYLSEKHLIPVQGIFVNVEEWNRWSRSDDPWAEVAAAVRADHSKLHPFRWGLVTLIATRAFIGV